MLSKSCKYGNIPCYNFYNVYHRLPLVVEMTSRYNRGRPQEFYTREFIAEYNGEKAGTCVLRYHGDKAKFPLV